MSDETGNTPLATLVAGLQLAQRVRPRADLTRHFARGLERGASHGLLAAEVQVTPSQRLPLDAQGETLLLETADRGRCRLGIARIRAQALAQQPLLVFQLSSAPLELVVPAAKGFGRVVQAGFLGRRLDDPVLGLLDRPLEGCSLIRQALTSRLGIPMLRVRRSLLCSRLLEGLGDAPRLVLDGIQAKAQGRKLALRLGGATHEIDPTRRETRRARTRLARAQAMLGDLLLAGVQAILLGAPARPPLGGRAAR